MSGSIDKKTATIATIATMGLAAPLLLVAKDKKKDAPGIDQTKMAADIAANTNYGLQESNNAYARKLAAAQKAQVLGGNSINTTTI